MRPLLLSLCFTSLVSSKYYSDGWKPGSPAQTAVNPGRTFDPHKPPPSTSGGFNSLLTGGPIGALLTSFGINMTEKIEEARIKEENKWDRRIPLIHDDNFDHLITHEKMSLPEEAERIWFILITVTAAQKDGISQFFDNKFDEAYEMTVQANDLKHVNWGRIDYMNVTRITTKWNVWRGPMLVVLADRGRTLRFLNAKYVRPQPELIRTWLLEKHYLDAEPWSSAFAPGGKREFILDYLAIFFQKWYDVSTAVPRWLFYIITAGLASVLLQVMHWGSTKPKAKPEVTTNSTGATTTSVAKNTTTTTSARTRKKTSK